MSKIVSFNSEIESFFTKYSKNGKAINVNFKKMVSELNKADRASHLIHTYPAKLLMHIPYFFLNNNILSSRGNNVLDPFCGSGTVLLESQLSGRNSFGADSNPLARLIAKVKTRTYDINKLNAYAERLRKDIKRSSKNHVGQIVNIDFWFLPTIKRQLVAIHDEIDSIEETKYKEFFLVCFSNCVKKVSLADPRVSVPVKLRYDQYDKNHPLNEVTKKQFDELKYTIVKDKFLDIVASNIARMKAANDLNLDKSAKSKIISNDARDLNKLTEQNGAVDLIITSPPYAGAQKYIRSSSLNIGWLNLTNGRTLKEIENLNIGRENYLKKDYTEILETGIPRADALIKKIHKDNPLRAHIAANYLQEMKEAFKESATSLKRGGYFVLIAANNEVCGHEFHTQQYLAETLENLGLTVRLRLIDDIKSYGLMTKRNKNASIITREWVLVFQK